MIYGLYCVRDKKSNYGAPFCETSDSTAMRAFAQGVHDTPLMRDNPGDFSLYHVGTFDDVRCVIEYTTPDIVMEATDA